MKPAAPVMRIRLAMSAHMSATASARSKGLATIARSGRSSQRRTRGSQSSAVPPASSTRSTSQAVGVARVSATEARYDTPSTSTRRPSKEPSSSRSRSTVCCGIASTPAAAANRVHSWMRAMFVVRNEFSSTLAISELVVSGSSVSGNSSVSMTSAGDPIGGGVAALGHDLGQQRADRAPVEVGELLVRGLDGDLAEVRPTQLPEGGRAGQVDADHGVLGGAALVHRGRGDGHRRADEADPLDDDYGPTGLLHPRAQGGGFGVGVGGVGKGVRLAVGRDALPHG